MQLNPDLIPPVDTDITRGTKNQCLPSKPGQGLQLFLPLFYLLEQQRQKFDPTKPPQKMETFEAAIGQHIRRVL
jgi:hypothetical protein